MLKITMGSRALLSRNFGRFVNNKPQCNYLSSSAVLHKNKQLSDVDKALAVIPTPRVSPKVFFSPKEKMEREKAMRSYITIKGEENAVGLVSGVPEEHIKTRTVRIYKPAKNAMQSGTDNTHKWQICFDTRERWENSLMGWCSSGDPLQATIVNFETLEEAEKHCKNMGWKYVVQKPVEKEPMPRSYGTNFSWDKRTRVSTK